MVKPEFHPDVDYSFMTDREKKMKSARELYTIFYLTKNRGLTDVEICQHAIHLNYSGYNGFSPDAIARNNVYRWNDLAITHITGGTKCNHKNCNKICSWGYEHHNPIRCERHKENDMKKVVEERLVRMEKEHGATKGKYFFDPSFGKRVFPTFTSAASSIQLPSIATVPKTQTSSVASSHSGKAKSNCNVNDNDNNTVDPRKLSLKNQNVNVDDMSKQNSSGTDANRGANDHYSQTFQETNVSTLEDEMDMSNENLDMHKPVTTFMDIPNITSNSNQRNSITLPQQSEHLQQLLSQQHLLHSLQSVQQQQQQQQQINPMQYMQPMNGMQSVMNPLMMQYQMYQMYQMQQMQQQFQQYQYMLRMQQPWFNCGVPFMNHSIMGTNHMNAPWNQNDQNQLDQFNHYNQLNQPINPLWNSSDTFEQNCKPTTTTIANANAKHCLPTNKCDSMVDNVDSELQIPMNIPVQKIASYEGTIHTQQSQSETMVQEEISSNFSDTLVDTVDTLSLPEVTLDLQDAIDAKESDEYFDKLMSELSGENILDINIPFVGNPLLSNETSMFEDYLNDC